MNAILDRIDDAMLSVAHKISDVVDQGVGIDHWSLASGMLNAGLACLVMATATLFALQGVDAVGFTISSVMSLLWIIVYQMLADRLKEQRRSTDAGRALKVSERRTRTVDLVIMFFIFAIQFPDVDVSDMFFMGGIAFFHLHYYFKAADLPPPSTSTRMAWSG